MPVLSAKRLAAVLAVLGAAFLQATPAEAAEQFPSGTGWKSSTGPFPVPICTYSTP